MTQEAIHILIVDSHSSGNRGDAAILQGLIDSLAAQLPNAIFKVHSTYPNIATMMHDVEANPPLIRRPGSLLQYLQMILKISLFLVLGISDRYGLDLTKWLPKNVYFRFIKILTKQI